MGSDVEEYDPDAVVATSGREPFLGDLHELSTENEEVRRLHLEIIHQLLM